MIARVVALGATYCDVNKVYYFIHICDVNKVQKLFINVDGCFNEYFAYSTDESFY